MLAGINSAPSQVAAKHFVDCDFPESGIGRADLAHTLDLPASRGDVTFTVESPVVGSRLPGGAK